MTNHTPHGQVPEALRIADEFKLCSEFDSIPSIIDIEKAEAELRRQHTRIAELESELEAVGAGGVQALSAAPARPTVEQVEDVVSMGHGAWDMVDPQELIGAVLRLAASPTPPAEQQAAPKAAPVEPSDVEIDAFLDSPAGITWVIASSRERYRLLVRAVLAKWGTQQEAQEPVAWLNPWRADQVTTDYDAYGERGIPLYTAPQPAPAPLSDDAKDAARLDWLALAGPTSICVVIDRPHDGEVEVATDDVTGYGKTLREALDAARKQGVNHD